MAIENPKDCLNVFEVAEKLNNPLNSSVTTAERMELATAMFCRGRGADTEPLSKYSDYECPPGDAVMLDDSLQPGRNYLFATTIVSEDAAGGDKIQNVSTLNYYAPGNEIVSGENLILSVTAKVMYPSEAQLPINIFMMYNADTKTFSVTKMYSARITIDRFEVDTGGVEMTSQKIVYDFYIETDMGDFYWIHIRGNFYDPEQPSS